MPTSRGMTSTTTAADCAHCDAVCCRLTVVLEPQDAVPARFSARNERGIAVMAHDADGWCAALDRSRMRCSIYTQRPQVCRRFVMDGPYCRAVRADYRERIARGIPLQLH